MKTLKNCASEKEIWRKESWREFVEELEDTLREVRKLLRMDKLFEEVAGKEIEELSDERLKEKVMTALLGGTDLPENPFSKLMYEKFGIKLGEASSWEESVETYRRLGGRARIKRKEKSIYLEYSRTWKPTIWIGHVENLAKDLETLIKKFEEKGLKLEPKEEEDIDPLDYLPSRGERPDRLIKLINAFMKKVNGLTLGTNPFVTFVTFVRFNYVDNVLEFLGLNRIEELKELIELLDLKLVDAIHLEFKKLEDYEPEKPFLLYGREGSSGLIYEKLVCGSDIYKFVDKKKVEEWMKQNLREVRFEILRRIPIVEARTDLGIYRAYEVRDGVILGSYRYYYHSRHGKYRPVLDRFENPVDLKDFLREIIPLSEVGVLELVLEYGCSINKNFPDVLNELLRDHEADQEGEA